MNPSTSLASRRLASDPTRLEPTSAAVLDLTPGPAVIDLTDGRHGATGLADPPAVGDPGVDHAVIVDGAPDGAPADVLAARWLTDREQAAAAARGDRARLGHVLGRLAAKQAAQTHLQFRGLTGIAGSRIEVTNDANGRPVARVRSARVATRHLQISIGHTGSVAVALATTSRREHEGDGPMGIGIDVERVAPRSPRFEQLTLTAAEQQLDPVPGDDRDTWLTRLWAAKEAAAKATGHGLQGRPKAFVVTRTVGQRLQIAGRWIVTERTVLGASPHILAWTANHRTECAWHRS